MLVQILLSSPVGLNGPMTTVQSVPFVGRCNVKILQVDAHFNGGFNWITIRSNTLLKPPFISKILVSNSYNYSYLVVDQRYQIAEYFGNSYLLEDVFINGKIDFRININDNINFTNVSNWCIIWLDIEYIK